VYVKDIWRNIGPSMRLLADDGIIYRKIANINNIGTIQNYLKYLGEWAVENGMKIKTGKVRQYYLRTLELKIQWVTRLVVTKFRKRAVVNTRA